MKRCGQIKMVELSDNEEMYVCGQMKMVELSDNEEMWTNQSNKSVGESFFFFFFFFFFC